MRNIPANCHASKNATLFIVALQNEEKAPIQGAFSSSDNRCYLVPLMSFSYFSIIFLTICPPTEPA